MLLRKEDKSVTHIKQAYASETCDSRPCLGRVTNMSRNYYIFSTRVRRHGAVVHRQNNGYCSLGNLIFNSFSFCEYVIEHEGQIMRLKSVYLTADASYQISKPIQTRPSIRCSTNAALPGSVICGPWA
jgi:hypothetical protein